MDIKPKKNDVWFIQVIGGSTIIKAKVIEITEKTVVLDDEEKKHWEFSKHLGRRKIADIEFIEKL